MLTSAVVVVVRIVFVVAVGLWLAVAEVVVAVHWQEVAVFQKVWCLWRSS